MYTSKNNWYEQSSISRFNLPIKEMQHRPQCQTMEPSFIAHLALPSVSQRRQSADECNTNIAWFGNVTPGDSEK